MKAAVVVVAKPAAVAAKIALVVAPASVANRNLLPVPNWAAAAMMIANRNLFSVPNWFAMVVVVAMKVAVVEAVMMVSDEVLLVDEATKDATGVVMTGL